MNFFVNKILILNFIIFSLINLYILGYPCSIKCLKSDSKSIFLISDYHISYNNIKEFIPNASIRKFNNYKILSCEKAFLQCIEKLNPIAQGKIDLFWESSENIHKQFINQSIFNTFLQLPFLKQFIENLENINLYYVDTWRGLFNYYSNLPQEYRKFIQSIEKLILDIIPIQIRHIENLENIKFNYINYSTRLMQELLDRLKDFYRLFIYPNRDSKFCEILIFPPKNIDHIKFWSIFNKLFIVDLADYKMVTDLLISDSKVSILYAGAMHCHTIEKILKNLDFKLKAQKFKDRNLNKLLDKFYNILERNYALLDGIATENDIKLFSKLNLTGPLPLRSSSFDMIIKHIY